MPSGVDVVKCLPARVACAPMTTFDLVLLIVGGVLVPAGGVTYTVVVLVRGWREDRRG